MIAGPPCGEWGQRDPIIPTTPTEPRTRLIWFVCIIARGRRSLRLMILGAKTHDDRIAHIRGRVRSVCDCARVDSNSRISDVSGSSGGHLPGNPGASSREAQRGARGRDQSDRHGRFSIELVLPMARTAQLRPGVPLTDQGGAWRVQRAIDSGEVVPGRALRALRPGHRRDWPRRAQAGPHERGPTDEDRVGRGPTRKAAGGPLDALQDLLELPYGGVLSDPSSEPRGQSSVAQGCPRSCRLLVSQS